MQYDVFIICPVRNASEEKKAWLKCYIESLESVGKKVYYPARDTNQIDDIGYRICEDNRRAIFDSEEIHIMWDKESQGSLFDLGMAFMLNKPLFIINKIEVEDTPTKSFSNMILKWEYWRNLL